ncbi:MAG: histidine phosphatase family protein [Candidatus Thiodiazotropha sp. (ex Semelilucina semeliformis)]|nr:histidine phosphatase family protein [Candidatus Thiodiazotropha sp. (ex Semelilucina semeliformis)]
MKTAKYLFLFIITSVLLASGCSTQVVSQDGLTTTVVLIRHAEKTAVTKVLTEGGKKRAAALPDAVSDLDIAAIYAPNLIRNIDTAKPLAKKRNIEITIIEDNPDWKEISQRLVSEHSGKTVLWVGNRGNLIKIYSHLGGTGEPPLEYGDLYIVRVTDQGEPKVIKRHFGSTYYR